MQLLGDVAHIVALVGGPGKIDLHAQLLHIPEPDADREDIHLAAGVVDVVLLMNVVSGGTQQAGYGRAVGGMAAVTDVQRTRWVGGDVFHNHASAGAPLGSSVRLPCVDDFGQLPAVGGGGHGEVDESGSGDTDSVNQPGFGDQVRQLSRDLAWRPPQRLGEPQGDIGCEVAVPGVAGSLQLRIQVDRIVDAALSREAQH